MDYIQQSDTLLQKDTNFLLRLADFQEEMKELQADMKLLSEELQHRVSTGCSPTVSKAGCCPLPGTAGSSLPSPAHHCSLYDHDRNP